MEQSNQNGKNDGLYWLIAIGLIVTGVAAPIGVLMIVLKLLGSEKPRGQNTYSASGRSGQTPAGARTTVWEPITDAHRNTGGTTPAPSPAQPQKRRKVSAVQSALDAQAQRSRMLLIIGGIVTALFGIALPSSLGDAFYWLFNGDFSWAVQEFFNAIPILCFLGGGVGCLLAGLHKRRQVSRFRGYLAMIGRKKAVSISALASATGLSPAQVRDDLAAMLDHGIFPQGFLDYGGDRLILSAEGLTEEPAPPKKQEEAPAAPTQSPEDAILAEIREVNDIVDNEKLSAQIDRIGVITAKILDYQKSHPDKAPQLHSFLSYYLPTTLKILRAYGQLEDQEVQGENITAAMKRIEGMMDKVVEGFEKQLDLLFQGDAMDLTADVEVLERMLAKDGLSDQDGMTLSL